MPPVARIGDTGSHGGQIVTGASKLTVEGAKAARVGDTYACPIHGGNPITSGSSITTVEGAALARIGDSTACGATITSGAAKMRDEG